LGSARKVTGPGAPPAALSCQAQGVSGGTFQVAEPTEALAARRGLGRQLAALRDAAGLTQHDLAPLVGYGRSTIGTVEIGKQRVPRRFWMRCDEIFATGGVLTEGYDRIEALEREAARVNARGLEDPSTADLASCTPQAAVDIDPHLVLHWTGMLRVLAASHNLFGPRQIHDAVCRESAVIRRYRREALGGVKTGLLGVEARWAEFASWTADNVGDRQAAAFWLDRALTLGRRADDGPLVAYVFMRQAQQAADHLDGARAAGLAETAGATAALTDRDRALCAIRQAQGHALRANRGACADAIKTAYRLVARADDTGVDEDPQTIGRHCGRPYVQAHEACCQLRLGHPSDAVSILEEILTGWPADYRQDEGLARAWLALSYAAANRPAEAGFEGGRALALTTVTWSARTMRALGQLDARLAIASSTAEVRQFRTAFSIAAAKNRM
jgi:transcriptional regulator with XRE-family HTH domain